MMHPAYYGRYHPVRSNAPRRNADLEQQQHQRRQTYQSRMAYRKERLTSEFAGDAGLGSHKSDWIEVRMAQMS